MHQRSWSGIPSPAEIARRFRADVTLPGWRAPARTEPAQVVYRGDCAHAMAVLDREAERLARERRRLLEAAFTPDGLQARGTWLRQRLRALLGLERLPPRTPLAARITGRLRLRHYQLEHVVFQSRPGLQVTANLYVPLGGGAPWPVVLHPPGHYPSGKAAYQRVAAVLASKGCAVLVPDPVGQGERDEYIDIATGTRTVARACRAHGVAGDPAYLLGGSLGGYRIWDCMRALDWLSSRSDIDAQRIGVVGTSGGGWESLWLAALDARVRAVCSSCYLTTWPLRMQRRGDDPEPDPEQDPFGVLSQGIDAADLLLACLPRPVALGATTRDFFPIAGTIACFREAARAYRLSGVSDRIELVTADAGHEYTLELRQQAYRWMLRWLRGERDADASEPASIDILDEASTWCTPHGRVLVPGGSITIGECNARVARSLALARRRRTVGATQVRSSLGRLLGIADPPPRLAARQLSVRRVAGGGVVQRLLLAAEDGHRLPARISLPRAGGRLPALVVAGGRVPSGLLAAAVRRRLVVVELAATGADPRHERNLDFVPLLEAGLAYNAFLVGRSLPGIRVAHILALLRWLAGHPRIRSDAITVLGSGCAALPALFAGCIDRGVSQVIEHRPLTSLSSLCWHREYAWPVSMIVPGLLRRLDLDDVRRTLAGRGLRILDPRDHVDQPLAVDERERAFAPVRSAFAAAGGPGGFSLLGAEDGNGDGDGIGRWLLPAGAR